MSVFILFGGFIKIFHYNLDQHYYYATDVKFKNLDEIKFVQTTNDDYQDKRANTF